MSHDHAAEPTEVFDQKFWDERYRSAGQIWSGNPNPHLVAQAADLTPGTVLEVGSGEGADAIWLASRGWQVTAVDLSPVALERAARHAADVSPQVADRIAWQQVDLLDWDPAPTQFDLVSAQFMHLSGNAREALHRRLAAAVGPGGSLLIVGHHPSDLETTIGRPHLPDLMYTPDQVASVLEPGDWRILVSAVPGRQAVNAEGELLTIHDTVLHAIRLR